jgi:hypothetical protein
MKRKIKRKVFLMGMALAAGLPSAALAKGNSKLAYAVEQYSGARHLADQGQTSVRSDEGISIDDLYGKLNRLTSAMHYNHQISTSPKPPVMQLQMLPASEMPADDPKMAAERRVGIALHIAF